jgi:hypothetical protein
MSDIAVNKVINAKGHPIEVTTVSGDFIYIQPGNTAGDAFGRLRTADVFTLFDSSHRYSDNGLWATVTGVNSSGVFDADAGLVNLTVDTTSGAYVTRETKKVFSYQPGKSLLVMSSFVMNPAQNNLRQRIGYHANDNGLYLQLNGSTLSFV